MSVEEEKFSHHKEEQKEALEYPKTFGGLFMEAVVRGEEILKAASKRDLSDSKRQEFSQELGNMVYDTLTLYKNKFFNSQRFRDWKDGLENIREYYSEFTKKRADYEEVDFNFEEKRKGYEALMRIARETINISCPNLKSVLKDLQKEFMVAWTNNNREKEAICWQSLEFIASGGLGDYKKMNDLLAIIK